MWYNENAGRCRLRGTRLAYPIGETLMGFLLQMRSICQMHALACGVGDSLQDLPDRKSFANAQKGFVLWNM